MASKKTGNPVGHPALTKAQREELLIRFYTTSCTMTALAEEYGISQYAVSRIVHNPKNIKKAHTELEARKLKVELRTQVAQIKAMEAAPDAIDQIIKISQQKVTTENLPYQYVIQNACVELLNRAGVKPKVEEENNEIVIRFANEADSVKLGMPDA